MNADHEADASARYPETPPFTNKGGLSADERAKLRAEAEEAQAGERYLKPWAVLNLLDECERLEAERDWNLRSSRVAKKRAIQSETALNHVRAVISTVKTDIEAFTYPEEVAGAVQDALDEAPEGSGSELEPRNDQQVVRVESVRIGSGNTLRAEFLAEDDAPDSVIHEHSVKVLAQMAERLPDANGPCKVPQGRA